MEELTKQQKHEIYSRALAEIKSNPKYNICPCVSENLWDVFRIHLSYCGVEFKEAFPELFKYKPEKIHNKSCGSWFPATKAGQKKRIAILEECIKLTEPEQEKCCDLPQTENQRLEGYCSCGERVNNKI